MRVEQGDAFSEVAAAHDEIIVDEHHDIRVPQKTEQCIALCTKSDRPLGIKNARRCRGDRVAVHIVRTGRTNRNKVRRSEEHTSELQSLMRNSYDVFCLKKKTNIDNHTI